MSIKSLFMQRSDTVESLQKKYRDIEGQKKSLEEKADRLRAESLKSDVDVSTEIQEIREEISLSDVALKETKKDLETMITKKIETDYQGLNQEKLEYETRLNDLTKKAGQNLGRGVQSLEILNLSFAHVLSRLIRETIVDYSKDRRFKNQMSEFLTAYSSEINLESDPVNFRDWKKRIIKVEGLEPGSLEAGRNVENQIKRLLSA